MVGTNKWKHVFIYYLFTVRNLKLINMNANQVDKFTIIIKWAVASTRHFIAFLFIFIIALFMHCTVPDPEECLFFMLEQIFAPL